MIREISESKGYDIDHFALVQREEWKELKIILK